MPESTLNMIVGALTFVLVIWAMSGFPAFWRKDK